MQSASWADDPSGWSWPAGAQSRWKRVAKSPPTTTNKTAVHRGSARLELHSRLTPSITTMPAITSLFVNLINIFSHPPTDSCPFFSHRRLWRLDTIWNVPPYNKTLPIWMARCHVVLIITICPKGPPCGVWHGSGFSLHRSATFFYLFIYFFNSFQLRHTVEPGPLLL